MRRTICHRYIAIGMLLGLDVPAIAAAQDARAPTGVPVVNIGSVAEERLRLRQLAGDTTLAGFLLRSTSSLTPRLSRDGERALTWQVVPWDYRLTHNSDLPYSLNDGPLWAGRGLNVAVRGGGAMQWGRVRLFLLPEFAHSQNRFFALPDSGPELNPRVPSWRNRFSSPWHANGQSIDLPIRYGGVQFTRFDPGQSSIVVDAGRVSVGVATENEWWGPGIRNALILSNNAPGFPHLFLRTSRPLTNRLGTFEARWLSGWLRESRYFDFVDTNDTRSIALLGVTWQPPWTKDVVLGAARSVFAPASGRLDALASAFDVLANVGQPNARAYNDSTITPGRDQLLSLFFRWVLPNDRFETYGEWARAEFPVSLRDFLVQANHTQGYTLGLQWLGEPFHRDVRLRAQAEVSFLEQSTTFRTRPIGSWYTSRAVVQGYTNAGQVIGAAIGPGSSSQFVALDAVASRWQLGAYLTRIRWLEDAHSQQPYVYDALGEHGVCEHDVSFLPGLRMSAQTRIGAFQADYSSGWRLNVFFENPGPCYFLRGLERDVRNKSLSLSFTPRSF